MPAAYQHKSSAHVQIYLVVVVVRNMCIIAIVIRLALFIACARSSLCMHECWEKMREPHLHRAHFCDRESAEQLFQRTDGGHFDDFFSAFKTVWAHGGSLSDLSYTICCACGGATLWSRFSPHLRT